jgi:hypothetical protein
MTVFSAEPSAADTVRIPSIARRSSAGSNDAAWSGPRIALSRVKCFSITHAPSATAA